MKRVQFGQSVSLLLVVCLLESTAVSEGVKRSADTAGVEDELPVTDPTLPISERSYEWPPYSSQSKYSAGFTFPEYDPVFGYVGTNVQRQWCTTPLGQSGECHPRHRCPHGPNSGNFCFLANGYPGVCCAEDKTTLSSGQLYQLNFQTSLDSVTTTQRSQLNDQSKCGDFVKEVFRIEGGNKAHKGEWPWMAALLRDGTNQFCGGVLVSDRHVLTVAHCVHEFKPAEIKVRLGEYDFSQTNGDRVDYSVSKIFKHEKFDRVVYVNDIAVLKLKRAVRFNERIRPICLPSGNVALEGRSAYVTGWGTTSYSGVSSNVLREVLLPIWRQSECRAALASWTFTDNQICAGYKPGGRDSCQGDSGGPLMLEETSHGWTVVGLVSWGLRCGLPNQPGVYTRVTSYLPWIKNKMLF